MNINGLLRRIKLNYHADFSDLPPRQKEALQAISQMIANNEPVSEDSIKLRISKTTDVQCVVWSLWHKKILIT